MSPKIQDFLIKYKTGQLEVKTEQKPFKKSREVKNTRLQRVEGAPWIYFNILAPMAEVESILHNMVYVFWSKDKEQTLSANTFFLLGTSSTRNIAKTLLIWRWIS